MVVEFRSWTSALITAALAAGLLQGAPQAQALELTIGGAFDDPNDVLLIEFSVDGSGPFTAFTSNFDPTNTLADPIDSILTLFSGTGEFASQLDLNDDGAFGFSATVNGVTFTGEQLDSLLSLDLAAGDYTLGLSSFPNLPAGPALGDGYSGADPDFDFGSQTGNFRVHLLGVDRILGTQGPAPVSPTFPHSNLIS